MVSPVQIQYLFSLLKHKNFQRAAEACHVTQPTLSMQIKKAEETVGFKIINRDTYPISLTHAGEKLIASFVAIDDAYTDLSIEIQKLQGVYTSEIRIGIIPTISNYLVPELYADWQEKIGDMHLDIMEYTSIELMEAVENKKVDFGILAGPLTHTVFEKYSLFDEEIFIYAPQMEGEELHLKQLENAHPWLLSPGNCLRTQMINFCQLKERPEKEWNYEGGNLNLLVKMVEQEGGYTLIPEHFIAPLNLDKKHIKRIANYQPFRRIIGISLKRNTKRRELHKIVRLIKMRETGWKKWQDNAELLPWNV